MSKIVFFAGLILATLTGCVTYHTERGTQALENPSAGDVPNYRTEWEVSQKRVTAEGFSRIWFGFIVSGETKYAEVPGWHLATSASSRAIHRAKAAATYEACDETNADALLGISYRYKLTNYLFFTTVSCEATGFPATVRRLVIQEDQPILIDKNQELIRLKPWEKVQNYSSSSINVDVNQKP